MSDTTADGLDRGAVAVSLGITLFGAAILAGLVYADTTTTLRQDYETFSEDCESLAGETRLEEDGIGMEPVELNNTTVRKCENTTFAEYQEGRYQSMQATPLNARQWAMYGGASLLFVAGGLALFGRQRRLAS